MIQAPPQRRRTLMASLLLLGRLRYFASQLILTAAVLIPCTISVASGQVVGGSIYDTVRNDTGSVLPEAEVTIKNLETGAERKLSTDDGGRYNAPSIGVGRYQVAANKQGFTTQVKTGID